jgi:uncharacterized protein YggT (Ycf19 family)
LIALLVALLALWSPVAEASVFMPYSMQTKTDARPIVASSLSLARKSKHDWRYSKPRSSPKTAMAIPGYGVAEQVFVGGFSNFLSIYNLIITARILLSWFPQAQGVALLQPIYAITDPYLNVFRGLIPPIFGLDFSPILAFFLLSVLGNVTAAVGYELPASMRNSQYMQSVGLVKQRSVSLLDQMRRKNAAAANVMTMDY